MNRIRRIRTVAVTVAGLACAWLGLAAFAPAAFAQTAMVPVPADATAGVPGPAAPITTRVIVTGGMPGWQIALIAIGAALFAAAAAVFVYRAVAAGRQVATTAA